MATRPGDEIYKATQALASAVAKRSTEMLPARVQQDWLEEQSNNRVTFQNFRKRLRCANEGVQDQT